MKETRIAEIRAAELPAGTPNSLNIVGTPIVFNQPTTINSESGSYTEIIRSGALDSADVSDVRLLYNHDNNRIPLARTPKTMQLTIDDNGLSLSASLPETAAGVELYEAIKRRDLSGISFAFTVAEDEYNPETNTRTINKIKKLYEVSVVPNPAYPQTSVEARARMEAADKMQKSRDEAKILINKILIYRKV